MLNADHKTILNPNTLRRIFFGGVILFLLFTAIGSLCYMLCDYEYLKQWFLSLNSCFYRVPYWPDQFFTKTVKARGNMFAAAGIVLSISGILYVVVRRRRYFSRFAASPRVTNMEWPWYVPVIALAMGTWYWGQGLVKPSADEIFSAVNIAELPSFQGLAYYMLPNNHIYFNFLNGLVWKLTGIDAVQSGRILSMLAYTAFLCSAYHWLAQRLRNKYYAYIAIVPIALQFTVWAFGFQARGYELQLFCAWTAFQSMWRYLDKGEARMLRLNTFVCIAGFALIPTFLYFYFAQTIFVVCYQIINRKFDTRFWKYQLFCLAGVFLLYLPALCFSGKDALAGNDYVKAGHEALPVFIRHWFEVTRYFLNFIFSFVIRENHPLNFILFFVPLLLLFSRERQNRWLGCYYIILWLTWAVVCCYMQRTPFSRNMIIHYGFTMVFVVYTLYWCTTSLLKKIAPVMARNLATIAVFGLPILVFSVHQATWGKANVHFLLYFMDVNLMSIGYNTEINNLPPGSSVVCSDERYCFYYYCRKRHYTMSKCPTGKEDYYVKCFSDELPELISNNYILIKKCEQGDDIYKRKQ